jgi:hypothetical protein
VPRLEILISHTIAGRGAADPLNQSVSLSNQRNPQINLRTIDLLVMLEIF